MKQLLKLTIGSIMILCNHAYAQEGKPEPSINIQYFNQNGNLQFLKIKDMVKEDNKLKPVPEAVLKVYLDEAIEQNLIATIKTNEKGEAKVVIPPALKSIWDRSYKHKFLAASDPTNRYGAAAAESEISKLRITVDTSNEGGTRKVAAQVLAFDSAGWKPIKGVELKLGVRRLGGDLKIGDEESYTTDSLGRVAGEFKLDKLPAVDAKNNIVLVAKTEDNESYGNVSFEKIVPWGTYVKGKNNFEQRSLWATRNKAPIWLILMASSIIITVWGVIIYLILQLRKIKKLGKLHVSPEANITRLAITPAEKVN